MIDLGIHELHVLTLRQFVFEDVGESGVLANFIDCFISSTPEFCKQLEQDRKDLSAALISNCNRKALVRRHFN